MSDPASADDQPVILAADDDEDILALVVFRLERSGYTVLQARDGEEALELAMRELPDLAVLDVMMPKLDGYEVTRRIRAADPTDEMPVILLTARVQDVDIARGFEAGADDYMKKPFSPLDLRARVEALLGQTAGPQTRIPR
jgi:DNA-binding response OmpR family regulator